MAHEPIGEPSKQSHRRTVAGGTVGGAVGVLVVMFMPENVILFTPEKAAMATLAFGTIFSWAMRFLPQPKN